MEVRQIVAVELVDGQTAQYIVDNALGIAGQLLAALGQNSEAAAGIASTFFGDNVAELFHRHERASDRGRRETHGAREVYPGSAAAKFIGEAGDDPIFAETDTADVRQSGAEAFFQQAGAVEEQVESVLGCVHACTIPD